MIFDKGSFRDQAGKIFYLDNKVYRVIKREGVERLNFLLENQVIEKSIKENYLIKSKIVNNVDINKNFTQDDLIFEHEKIPYISYPYEWSFSQLKAAALHHLEFHLYLLDMGANLIDASAYNIQFIGNKPIFIDLLSLKKYEEGEYWIGHKQFCENFLNPLILQSKKGVYFNNWFKGNLEGIKTEDLNNILSFKDKLSYNIFVQVYLLNKFDQSSKNSTKQFKSNFKKKFSKKSFYALLKQIRNFIQSLKPKKNKTIWEDYSQNNTYDQNEETKKIECVSEFISKNKFQILCDLGCNNGLYSSLALEKGTKKVVGFDYDINAIEEAYNMSKKKNYNFLPLYLDASNPSTRIGWNENERKSFNDRANFDCVLALAFKHHLSLAKNIPLDEVIMWIISLAPKGLIEFIPKSDETVKKMLEIKGDIFQNYTEKNFEKYINENGKIISITNISKSGRKIYEFER